MLEVKDVTKTYSAKKGKSVQALCGVTLTFGERGMYFLLGKSGSGKSTLLNILGGLDRADGGEIFYDGVPFSSFSEQDFSDYRNGVVGFVFQEYNLLENFTAAENVALALRMQGKEVSDEEAEAALEKVGLAGYGKRQVSELSGGQKQRVAIARAIVKDSALILADEPTGNLDSETGAEIFGLLRALAQEKTVIVVSHDRENAEKYGDAVIELKDGRVQAGAESLRQVAVEMPERVGKTWVRTRLPFSFAAKMARHNLFQKKWRSLITIAATALSVMVICLAQVFYAADTERNIARSAEDLGKEYLSLRLIDGKDGYGYPQFVPHIDERSYGYLQEQEVTFVRTVHFNNVSAFIFEDEGQMQAFGAQIYGEAAWDAEGYYVSDHYIDEALSEGAWFAEGALSYEDMAGKELLREIDISVPMEEVPVVSLRIAGVFRTPYAADGSIGERMNAEIFRENLFCSEMYYRNFAKAERVGTYGGWKLTAEAETAQKSFEEDAWFSEISGRAEGGVYALGTDGYRYFTSETLGKDEVLVSRRMYNALFGQELPSWPHDSDEYMKENTNGGMSAWYLADAVPEHIGERVDFKAKHALTGEEVFFLQGKKIAGVVFGEGTPNRYWAEEGINEAYFGEGAVSGAVSYKYSLYNDTSGLYMRMQGAAQTEQILRTLRTDFSMGVGNDFSEEAPFDFGFYFYMQEGSFAEMRRGFLLIAAASFAIAMLLLIALISFGISSRKKEIGILKALGCGNGDIRKIYVFEAFLIGMFTLLLSLPAVYFSVRWINNDMCGNGLTGITYIMADTVSWLLAAGVSVVAVLLFAYIPLCRISRMKPADAIRGH